MSTTTPDRYPALVGWLTTQPDWVDIVASLKRLHAITQLAQAKLCIGGDSWQPTGLDDQLRAALDHEAIVTDWSVMEGLIRALEGQPCIRS